MTSRWQLPIAIGALLFASYSLCLGQAAKDKSVEKDPPSASQKQRQAIAAEAEALASKGRLGAVELAKKLREENIDWKIEALRALRNLGPDAEPAVDAIIEELRSKKHGLERLTIGTLRGIGPKAKAALPLLLEAAKVTSDFDGSFAKGGSSNIAEAALEAVKAIDPEAMPRLADAMIPGLLDVVAKGREPAENAVSLLRQLGPNVKPALPTLKELIPKLSPHLKRDLLPVFLVAGEEGMAILADVILDGATNDETRIALISGYRWERESTASSRRILRGLLKSKSPRVRASALGALATVRDKELIPDLVELLPDAAIIQVQSDYKGEDPFHVARALGNQGGDALPALTKALELEAPLARFQAARALAYNGKAAAAAIPALEKLLNDSLPIIQIEAAKAILSASEGNADAIAKLEKHLQTDSKFVGATLEAVRHLRGKARPLFPAVKKLAFNAEIFPLQRASFEALRTMQGNSAEVVQVWNKLVHSNAWFLNFPPRDEIAANPKMAQAAIPDLLKHLESPDVNVRRRVTEVFEILGPAAKETVPALIKALNDRDFVAGGAMNALGAMGSDAAPAVKVLVEKFENLTQGEGKEREKDLSFRKEEILRTLGRIGPSAAEAAPALVRWLPDEPSAARILGKIGPKAKFAIPALEKAHQEGTTFAKTWAAFALVKLTGNTEPYVSELSETLLKSKEYFHRRNAIDALIELGPDARAALPALLLVIKEKKTDDWGSGLRREAAQALFHFGPDAAPAVPDLIDMVETSYHAAKVAAAETLGSIGPAANDAVPALEKMAELLDDYRPLVDRVLAKIRTR